MKILVIDDEPANRDLLREYLEFEGFDIVEAENGRKALDVLDKEKDFAVILLDRMMPEMDGMSFMEVFKVNDSIKNIPVIMQTAAADNRSIEDGINLGVYYYLTKPYRKNILIAVVQSAIRDGSSKKQLVSELRSQKNTMVSLASGHFHIRTMDDAHNLASLLANSFPDSERVILGLSEIIINAVEHGNLGISCEEKSEFMRSGVWADEINRRLELPENKDKQVEVFFEKSSDKIVVTVKDSGKGFDWKEYLQINVNRATYPNGRGIFMAKSVSFDEIEYLGCGNEVVCTVFLK